MAARPSALTSAGVYHVRLSPGLRRGGGEGDRAGGESSGRGGDVDAPRWRVGPDDGEAAALKGAAFGRLERLVAAVVAAVNGDDAARPADLESNQVVGVRDDYAARVHDRGGDVGNVVPRGREPVEVCGEQDPRGLARRPQLVGGRDLALVRAHGPERARLESDL